MSQLPLQLRKDVRDLWEKEDSPVQTSFKKLAGVIGWQVSCDPQWPLLWAEIGPAYSDKAIFVPTIAGVVEAWADTLVRRLEDDKYEEWTEELLGKIEPVSAVKLYVEAADESRPKITWSSGRHGFTVSLPKKTIPRPRESVSGFQTDLEALLEDPKASAGIDQSQSLSREDDDWANVESTADSRSISIRPRESDVGEQRVEALPSLQTLPKPDVLFQSLTPYLMQVSSNGQSRVTVTGTHEPSLRLLAEYLQRWIKTDPQDIRKIPFLRIKLNESIFGLGLFYDSITMEPFDHHQRPASLNVTLILAFIQGVLGYSADPETSGGGHWEFRRTTPFRT